MSMTDEQAATVARSALTAAIDLAAALEAARLKKVAISFDIGPDETGKVIVKKFEVSKPVDMGAFALPKDRPAS